MLKLIKPCRRMCKRKRIYNLLFIFIFIMCTLLYIMCIFIMSILDKDTCLFAFVYVRETLYFQLVQQVRCKKHFSCARN